MLAYTDSSLYRPRVSAVIILFHVGQYKEPGPNTKPICGAVGQSAKTDH